MAKITACHIYEDPLVIDYNGETYRIRTHRTVAENRPVKLRVLEKKDGSLWINASDVARYLGFGKFHRFNALNSDTVKDGGRFYLRTNIDGQTCMRCFLSANHLESFIGRYAGLPIGEQLLSFTNTLVVKQIEADQMVLAYVEYLSHHNSEKLHTAEYYDMVRELVNHGIEPNISPILLKEIMGEQCCDSDDCCTKTGFNKYDTSINKKRSEDKTAERCEEFEDESEDESDEELDEELEEFGAILGGTNSTHTNTHISTHSNAHTNASSNTKSKATKATKDTNYTKQSHVKPSRDAHNYNNYKVLICTKVMDDLIAMNAIDICHVRNKPYFIIRNSDVHGYMFDGKILDVARDIIKYKLNYSDREIYCLLANYKK